MIFVVFIGLLAAYEVSGERSPRVINGHPTAPGDHPYLALLRIQSAEMWYFVCGGTLIAPNKIVIAAHCITRDPAYLDVVLGDYHVMINDTTEQFIPVASYVIHPDYNGDAAGFPHDIAVITLTHDAELNNATSVIAMASPGQTFAGTDCTVSGWGSTSGDITLVDTPTSATFPTITNQDCHNFWAPRGQPIGDGHICMMGPGAEATCHYDNGGPMVCGGLLAGIISWGDSKCDGRLPTVMTRVGYYRDWIQSH